MLPRTALPGAKTRRVFIPSLVIPSWSLSPFWPRISGGRARYALAVLPRTAPAGGENPAGFHPFVSHPIVKPLPVLAGNQRQAGRIPSCGGCASPSGAQCRRMTVFCLPGTMPD
ncbi:MAG: hypothetical protein LBK61_08530, partial [Spirochaetaceae bacterium]|nr:hypothetical protein [Spirochaetaceae bacterium]